MIRSPRPILLVLSAFFAFFTLFPSPASARQSIPSKAKTTLTTKPAKSKFTSYSHALEDIDDGNYQPARSLINRGGDRVLDNVLRGYLMARPGNDYSFDELAGFITDHPDWFNLSGIVMIAEQKIPSSASADQIVNWFNAYPPVTQAGFVRYIDALNAQGHSDKATALIRDRWVNKDFSSDELAAFHARFGQILTRQDHNNRLDRLLWDNSQVSARAMFPYVGDGERALAEARLALAAQDGRAESLLNNVPSSYKNDPGLLFERLRWRRKNNMDDSAIELLMEAPGEPGRPDIWWDERHILVRRVMEKGDYKLAYKLASAHGIKSGFDFVQAEFVSGWLALRFLNRPDTALTHFKALFEAATTPMSRARGAYWMGRTYEALNDKISAEQAYQTAGALNTTFYGQLALTRIYADPVIRSDPEPAIPPAVRAKFFARDSVRAVERLYQIGQRERARGFFKAITTNADQRVQFVLLMELGYQLQRPDWAINASKAAAQKNMLVGAGSFPVLSLRLPTPPEPAFTHALIRQESHFNTDASSPAGARGLMQLMPATAKGVCKKISVAYHPQRLSEPDYNVRLGTAFAQEQLDGFDGSYILALAGYNAGPRRVREWIEQFGDPRSPRVDPVDWIEHMPIYETRNYVQRVIENLQFYRARLNGGQAPLLITKDLKR